MNHLEFTFDTPQWELYLEGLEAGQKASAATLLTLTDGEDEAVLEDILQEMEERGIGLDVSTLPKTAATGEAARRLRQEEQLVKKGLNPGQLEEGDPLRL